MRGDFTAAIAAADQRYEAGTRASRLMHARAEQVLPGGTSSSSRAFRNYPLYIHRGEGCRLYDVDGREIVDLMNANASVVLGHNHPGVTAAVAEQVGRGFAFQNPGDNMVEFAELLQRRTPSLERMRFTCSGTEATMFAIRLARAFTGRRRVLLMDGSYHGFHDVGATGDGPNQGEPQPGGDPAKPVAFGVDPRVAEDVDFGQFNDVEHCLAFLDAHPGEYAAVMVEPMFGAGGNIAAEAEFLPALRKACDRHGTLLVFDETITYSVSTGAAQGHFGVRPDLTTAGKPIANGMPVGVFGGRADIMALCEPHGGRARLQHSSSFTAHPVVMAAGVATLHAYDAGVVDTLDAIGNYTCDGIKEVLRAEGVVAQVTGLQHLFGLHFVPEGPVLRYADVRREPPGVRAVVAFSLLSQGYLMSGYRGAVNAATTTGDIDGFLDALRITLRETGLGAT